MVETQKPLEILVVEDNFVKDANRLANETLEERTELVKKILNIDVDLNVKEDYNSGLEEIETNSSAYDHIITDIGLEGPYMGMGTICNADRIASLLKEKAINLYERFEKGIKEQLSVKVKNKRIPLVGKIETFDLFSNIFKEGVIPQWLMDNLESAIELQSGADLAYRMKQKNLQFTIFTKDLGHSLEGLVSLLVEDVITPEDIIEIVEQYKPVGMMWNTDTKSYEPGNSQLVQDEAIYLNKNKKLAIGNKSLPQSWATLIGALC